MITDLEQLDLNKRYTYSDYVTWKFKERVELIKGKLFKVSPALGRTHQKLSIRLASSLFNFVKKPCEVYEAPFDVKLVKGDDRTVVQPDICVICDPAKLTDFGCEGAPELIIEILSPGNSRKEMKEKFELYEENGVEEYWLVNPQDQTILIYNLQKGKYAGSKPYIPGEVAASPYLRGFEVDTKALIAD